MSDYSGTLAEDGILLPGVREKLNELSKIMQIHIVTSDTFGKAKNELAGVSCSITVRLPAEFAFELSARSASGRIHSAHPVTVTGTLERRELRGKVRGGGPLLALSTSSGSIRIE